MPIVTPLAAQISRRQFLKASVTAGGGLLLGITIPMQQNKALTGADSGSINAFVRIDPDNTVTIQVPRPELGQGVRTSLPMILADELGVPLNRVRVEQAEIAPEFEDLLYSGGSHSVRFTFEPMRKAGAAAREMLKQAAALSWNVAPSTCRAVAGVVHHDASGRSSSYGELAASAARLPVPDDPPLKLDNELTIIGTAISQFDNKSISTGSIEFSIDKTLPGMLTAVIQRAPRLGASARQVNNQAALDIQGVKSVLRVKGDDLPARRNEPRIANGVAVLADNYWHAKKGRDALQIEWTGPDGEAESEHSYWGLCESKSRSTGASLITDEGDVDKALASAAHTIEAVYRLPFLSHAQMEPLNCLADVKKDRADIWVGTQNLPGARDMAAEVTGLPTESVRIHPLRCGGGFGRKYYSDFVAEAAYLSQRADRPVKLIWSREDDMRNGAYRPPGYYTLKGGVDKSGRIVAWHDHLVNASRNNSLGWNNPQAEAEEIYHYGFPHGFVPNLRLEYTQVDSVRPRGQWRAVEDSSNVFVTESFLDELAYAGGRDPLDLRLETMGNTQELPFWSRTYDVTRLKAVFERVAEKANWGRAVASGRGLGIAGAYANSSYVAYVADVSVNDRGILDIRKITAAVDCGRVVNPSGARAQIEGGIVYGLSAALWGQITIDEGRVVEGNFDRYRVMRISEMPEVDIHFVQSNRAPTGLGEPPLPPIAPALTNAIYAATGKRIRRLPVGEQLGDQRG